MKNTILLIATILVAFTFDVRGQAPADPIQQAFVSLQGNKDLHPETQKALKAATEALRLPPITVKTDRDREIICNRIEANASRYRVLGDNTTDAEKEALVTKLHAAYAAGIAAIKGQSVTGDRQEHIEQLLRILGHVHLDVAKGGKYADVTRGYYAMAIRAIAAAPASGSAGTPPANPPPAPAPQAPVVSANVQVNVPQPPAPPVALQNPPAPKKEPAVTAPPQTSAPAAPAPPAQKRAITRTPTAPHVAQ